ncbi:MAG: dTMP kinase [Desulfobacterales bacterium]|nr:dTMP kinase [Desulfobacterales bacterium]
MFITLEGIEGSGKTTQMENMVAFLENRGHSCAVTREPGGTPIGRKIRSILLDPESKGMDPLTELMLYMADRAQHIKTVVLPAMKDGKIILCDRYFDATLVYQGMARGLDVDLINNLHNMVLDGLKPDITFLLDLPPEVGLSRAWKQINSGDRTGSETRFENEKLAFHEKVRAGYLELSRLEPDRYNVVDAVQSAELVQRSIESVLSSFIK